MDTDKEQPQVYKAYKHMLSRCKNTKGIEFIMIKIIFEDETLLMFYNILSENEVKLFEDLVKYLIGGDDMCIYKVRASTTEGDITISNQEDFYCALILYLNECSGEELEKPMKITITSTV